MSRTIVAKEVKRCNEQAISLPVASGSNLSGDVRPFSSSVLRRKQRKAFPRCPRVHRVSDAHRGRSLCHSKHETSLNGSCKERNDGRHLGQSFPLSHLSFVKNARLQFSLVIVLVIASVFFWDTIVLYPVKIFVVLMHEISHGLAAVATGGSIQAIEIDERIGGVCHTLGGWGFAIASAGYLGSMALGSGIFLAALRHRVARPLGVFIGAAVLIVTVLYVRNFFGIAFGVLFGAGMIAAVKYLPANGLQMTLQYLGAVSCLYALIDIKEDLLTLEHRTTDAALLASMTGIPALVWGILWSVLALVVFIVVLRSATRTMFSSSHPTTTQLPVS